MTGADGGGGDGGPVSVAGSPPPSTKPGTLHVGTAGFSYPDWAGPVWGGRAPAGPQALAALSGWVDLLEVNVSHYRIPAVSTAASWLEAVAPRGDFRFTAKVWKGFTHGPERPTHKDLADLLAFFAALAADGRLLAALAQFPPSFRATPRREAYVHRLKDHLAPHPLAVEFRDASWDTDEVRAGLAERGIAWVAADLPPGPRAIVPRPVATAPLAYVRLHGRSPAWYLPGAGRDRKYDHLYDAAELLPWLDRIERLRERAARVVVVTNNHYAGKALANALEIKAAAEGGAVEVPAALLAAYPRLAAVAREPAAGDPRS
jgi:uncharacterized protein YecE (DUF72 family)